MIRRRRRRVAMPRRRFRLLLGVGVRRQQRQQCQQQKEEPHVCAPSHVRPLNARRRFGRYFGRFFAVAPTTGTATIQLYVTNRYLIGTQLHKSVPGRAVSLMAPHAQVKG